MNILSYILWNPSLEAFSIGPFSIRWYSLMQHPLVLADVAHRTGTGLSDGALAV